MAAMPIESFISVNGARLQCLEWGEDGPPLLLIHGLAYGPHDFDDLAPALADQFHVFALARRGCNGSEARRPYDLRTLSLDLLGALNALKLDKVHLASFSAGGDEMTALATIAPDRVNRIVYLDSGFDYSDPEKIAADKALPPYTFELPDAAMRSLDAYRNFQKQVWYPDVDDMRRIEFAIRQHVVIQEDGSLRTRISRAEREAMQSALWAHERRDYSGVQSAALAIYADRALNIHSPDPVRRADAIAWERDHWQPIIRKAIAQIQRELPTVRVIRIPNSLHCSFYVAHRVLVVSAMRQFLLND
jgi:pimeloyl-ACP methyl ester carboxylesterase